MEHEWEINFHCFKPLRFEVCYCCITYPILTDTLPFLGGRSRWNLLDVGSSVQERERTGAHFHPPHHHVSEMPRPRSLREDKDSDSLEPQSFQTTGRSSSPPEFRRAGSGKSYFTQSRSRLSKPHAKGVRIWPWEELAHPLAKCQQGLSERQTGITADVYPGTGSMSPECRLPSPGRPWGQRTGSSVSMSSGTLTATAGLGCRTPGGSPGSGFDPVKEWGSNLLSDYLFPSSCINRLTPSHNSERQLEGKWLDYKTAPSG